MQRCIKLPIKFNKSVREEYQAGGKGREYQGYGEEFSVEKRERGAISFSL